MYLSLFTACTQAGMAFSAARTLRTFCTRFSRHPEVARAQQDLGKVLALCSDLLATIRERERFPLDGAEAAQFFAGHERMQVLMAAGRNEEALELGRTLERQVPDWPPLLNNLNMALGYLGRNEEALVHLERALAAQPDNVFALAERVKRLFLLGRGEEAAARALWQRARELQPDFAMARENLDDLKRPPGERHGPYYLDASSWLPRAWMEEFAEAMKGLKTDAAIHARARQLLDGNPGLLALLPALLDRGDEHARTFAVAVCRMAETSETLAMLRDFVLGQRGPDRLRLDTLSALNVTGTVPLGPVRMWHRGSGPRWSARSSRSATSRSTGTARKCRRSAPRHPRR